MKLLDEESQQELPSPPPDLLQTWKEIAAYLDATERSAQRWERLEGLPVHRQTRSKRSAVYAYKSEIEQWRRERSTSPDPAAAAAPSAADPSRWRLARGLLLAASVAAATGVVYWAITRPAPAPRFGGLKPMPEIAGTIASPALSPDGSRLAFAWQPLGQDNYDLAVLEAGADRPRRLRKGPTHETSPAWSPDGKRLAFCRIRPQISNRLADLVLMDADGSNERELARVQLPPAYVPWSLGNYVTWTPDGSALVAPPPGRGQRAGLARIDIATGEVETLTQPSGYGFDSAPALSADGRYLAFLRSSVPIHADVYAVDLQAPERILVRLTDTDWPGPPAFVAGSAHVLATVGRLGGNRRLFAFDPSGSAPAQELPGAPADLYSISVSADGRAAAGLAGQLEVDLYRATLKGPTPRIEKLLERPGVETLPALSLDGSTLAVEFSGGGEPEGLYLLEGKQLARRLLTSDVGTLGGPPAWSPDGRRLAIAAADDQGQHVYVVDAEGGDVEQISSGPERAFPPRWSLDGRALVTSIVGPRGTPLLHRLAYPGGEILGSSESAAVISQALSDGAVAQVDRARNLSIGRGAAEEPVANLYWRHTMDVRGTSVAFLRHNGRGRAPSAEIYDAESGESRWLADLPGAWRGFAISADGRTIYFDRREAETAQLRMFGLKP